MRCYHIQGTSFSQAHLAVISQEEPTCMMQDQNANTTFECIADAATSHVARLNDIMTLHFPQYLVVYQKIPVAPPQNSMESQTGHSVERFKCVIKLFGMPIETYDVYADWEAAKESAAKSSLLVLEEFLRILQGKSEDPVFGKIFRQMDKEMSAYRPPDSKDADSEAAKLAAGHDRVLSLDDGQPSEESQRQVLGPLLNSVVTKVYNPVLQLSREPVTADQNIAIASSSAVRRSTPLDREIDSTASIESNSQSSLTSFPVKASSPAASSASQHPLSTLMMHYQKRANTIKAPEIVEFQGKASFWGSHGHYFGFQVTIKAVYKKKSDARYEAARRLYLLVMPDNHEEFPMKSPDIGDEDPEAKDVVIANSTSMISSDSLVLQPVTKTMLVSPSAGCGNIDEYLKDLPKEPLDLEAISGKTYVSIVNEYCQQTHQAAPDYKELTVNQSLTLCYCCRVESFDGRPFTSYVFARKKDAKEECAMQIFLYLRDKKMIDAKGKVIATKQSARPLPSHHQQPLYPPPPMPFPPMVPPFMMGHPPPSPIPSKRPGDDLETSTAKQDIPYPPPMMHPQMAAYHQMMAMAMMHHGLPPMPHGAGAVPPRHHYPWPPMPPYMPPYPFVPQAPLSGQLSPNLSTRDVNLKNASLADALLRNRSDWPPRPNDERPQDP